MSLRARLVRTPIGRWAIKLRDVRDRWRAMTGTVETAGMVANDQLALRLTTRLARPGTGFLDVGAHVGSVLALAARGRDVRLFAVEAMPDKAKALRRRFPEAQIFECAAGDQDGEATFFVDEAQSGYSSLDGENRTGAAVREIVVPLRRIDDLVGGQSIDVMKIDVEGAELGVLRGSEAMVAACRPTIIFESGPRPAVALGYTIEALWNWFEEHDYAVLVPNRVAHIDAGLHCKGFIEAHLYPRRTTNYVAVARERRGEVQARARRALGL